MEPDPDLPTSPLIEAYTGTRIRGPIRFKVYSLNKGYWKVRVDSCALHKPNLDSIARTLSTLSREKNTLTTLLETR